MGLKYFDEEAAWTNYKSWLHDFLKLNDQEYVQYLKDDLKLSEQEIYDSNYAHILHHEIHHDDSKSEYDNMYIPVKDGKVFIYLKKDFKVYYDRMCRELNQN